MECPVCEGKMSIKDVYEAYDKRIDATLCKEHLNELSSYFIEKDMSQE